MLSSGRLRVLSNGRVSSIRCVQIDRLQYNILHFGVGSNTQYSSGLQIEMFHARGGSPVRFRAFTVQNTDQGDARMRNDAKNEGVTFCDGA